jgi:hypothetical protein
MSAERCRCTNFNFTALSTNCPNKCGDIDSNYECGGQAQASVTASTYRYVFRQAPPQELGRCHSLPSLSSTSQILPVSTIRLTPEYCQAMCSLARTPTRFFGIHDGQECVCFDESPVDTRECNIPCQGDSRICSGVGAVLSYPLMSKELPPYEDEQHFVGSAGFWLMLASIGLVVVISIFYTITVIRTLFDPVLIFLAGTSRLTYFVSLPLLIHRKPKKFGCTSKCPKCPKSCSTSCRRRGSTIVVRKVRSHA